MPAAPDDQTVHLLAKPAAAESGVAGVVATTLANAGWKVNHIAAPTAAEAQAQGQLAIAGGSGRLVVIGGDGMVHIGVNIVAGTGTILGVIPHGTGNDFAGAMGLPNDLAPAVRAAIGPAEAIDAIRIGDRWAASIATIGFAADVNERANAMRWPKGQHRYSVATVATLPGLRTTHYDFELDGEPFGADAVLVTMANTTDFGGGMRISPAADPADGVLELTIVGDASRFELLRFFRRVYDGSHLNHRKVTTARSSQIRLLTPGIQVWADGEPVATSPIDISVAPGALRLAGAVT